MAATLQAVLARIDETLPEATARLLDLPRIPSVSTDPAHAGDCRVEFTGHRASPASVMATDNPAFEKARRALSREWPRKAVFVGCGGSIPVAGHFREILGMDALLTGFGRDDDNIHSPNEKYDLECFHKGIRSWARIIAALAAD